MPIGVRNPLEKRGGNVKANRSAMTKLQLQNPRRRATKEGEKEPRAIVKRRSWLKKKNKKKGKMLGRREGAAPT